MTKTKTPPIYGEDLPITTFQIKTIRKNSNWQEDIKDEWVQWVTGDNSQTSLKSLTQAQAVKIIRQQTGDNSPVVKANEFTNWGYFDRNNSQHARIQANLYTANIVVKNDRHGEVADMEGWFNRFLKSPKSPVKKPLKDMTPLEVSKIIKALDGVALWKNSI
ncbi:hypothetical protein QWY99_08590 [Flavobacterium branchiarum]|uniref:Uncharacterized protein n=1 Tax=Flavobacterium branchiarum TaxID=1114870 RepID=A0ABV5FPW9_9FLAO|nr:hypothetical protein [Flavobacterium branchiarum]MDN3673103.1 hypothetical protein [Flavobacterium branchiarum]